MCVRVWSEGVYVCVDSCACIHVCMQRGNRKVFRTQ